MHHGNLCDNRSYIIMEKQNKIACVLFIKSKREEVV